MMLNRPLNPSTVLVLLFAAAITAGSLLLALPAAQTSGLGGGWLTALFTATSAVCVTGLAVVDTGTHWTLFGQAVILGLIQIGGFGLMTAASLLGMLVNSQLRVRARLLLQAENRALSLGDVRSVAKLVLVITLTIEALAALVLMLRFMQAYEMGWREAAWQGLFHAVSAFNNAGFSTFPNNLMRFVSDGWVLSPLMLAIVIGGLGFPVLHELLLRRGQRARLSLHSQLTLVASGLLLLGGAAAFAWSEWRGVLAPLDGIGRFWGALFAAVSARTAGFNSLDVAAFNTETLVLHYLLMFIGGGSAGTAGGLKVTTAAVLLLAVWCEVRGYRDVEFAGRRLNEGALRQALTVLVLCSAVVGLATLTLVPLVQHLPGVRFEAVLFEVVSAFATVGLSTGLTPQLPPAGQMLLVGLMFLGRVGIVTLAVALAQQASRRPYRYPEEKPLVG
jgi:trk system potassium uptake protein TrkH